ncbi:MAG: HAMP domain-containing protein [Candidatus Omnitrophota bacterium]
MALSFGKTRNIGLFVMVVALIIIGLIPSLSLIQTAPSHKHMYREISELQTVLKINKLLTEIEVIFNRVVKSEGTESTASCSDMIKEIIDQAGILEKIAAEEENAQEREEETLNINKFLKSMKRFKVSMISYAAELEWDPAGSTANELEKLSLAMLEKTHDTLFLVEQDVLEDVEDLRIEIESLVRANQNFSLFALLIGLFASLFMSIFMNKALNRPIIKLLKGIEKITKGDLSYKVDVEDDEVGQLAKSFNGMAEQLLANREEVSAVNKKLLENEKNLLKAQEALEKKIQAIESFNKMAVGRELRMVELKREINRLSRELGRAEPYEVTSEEY